MAQGLAMLSLVGALLAFAAPALAQPRPPAALPMERQDTEIDPEDLLDDDLLINQDQIDSARTRAAQQPPQTQDPAVLARFFLQRGKAQKLVGHEALSLRDLRQAVGFARRAQNFDRRPALTVLADAESSRNNYRQAIALLEEAVRLTPEAQRGRTILFDAQLARTLAVAGNLERAEAVLADAESMLPRIARGGGRRNTGPRQTGNALERALQRALPAARVAIAVLRGRYDDAELYQRALIDEVGTEREEDAALLRRGLANILRLQGRLAEAENESRSALVGTQKRFGVNSINTSSTLINLGAVLSDQGRHGDAEAVTRKAYELVRNTGRNGNRVRTALANILAAQGRWSEALAEYEAARRQFGDDAEGYTLATGQNLNLPLAMLKGGNAPEALKRFQALFEARQRAMGDKHFATAEARGLYALALAATGQAEPAARELAAAVPILLERSRAARDDSDGTAQNDQRLRLILEGYIDLLADLRGNAVLQRLGIDAVAESFRLADAARGQSVSRAVAESGARAAAKNPALASLARAEQDAQKQIAALNGLLANAISARAEERDEAGIRALRTQVDTLRDRRAKAVEEIEKRFPAYAQLIDPRPATLAQARAALRPGEAMVAFYAGETRTYVWATLREGAAAFAAVALPREALAAAVGHLREALEPDLQKAGDVPPFDVAAAYKLYETLLRPVAAGWRDARQLFVVPHGALGQLPLSVLPTEAATPEPGGVPFGQYRKVAWLARSAAVTQLPTVASLAMLRTLPAGNAARRPFVGFGDPLFSKGQPPAAGRGLVGRGARPLALRKPPRAANDYTAQLAQLPRLPETADEVTAIAAALRADPARDVFLGAKASEAVIGRTNLAQYKVVMFATHGLVPGDLAGLTQPALALSAPDVTGESGDGLLTVENILSLKLDADWVVLSACNTAAAQGAGAEAVSGLGRAFFYAGTRALLVSNWPVETTSARALTSDLFKRQADNPGLARAEALRQAMIGLIDGPGLSENGAVQFSYAHPIFWAPFSLVGDGGVIGAR